MKTKLIRILRIESSELDPFEEPEEITEEEFERLPEYEPDQNEIEAEQLLKVQGMEGEVDIEMMKKTVDVYVDDNTFKELLNLFKLYKVPFKFIENGIEVDVRRKMRKKYERAED